MLGLGSDVLVPLKLDLTHGEGRLLDSFTWSLHGHSHTHSLTLEQFAWHTCLDLNLPSELVPRIVAQLEEQLEAFHALESLVHSLAHSAGEHSALWERLSSVVTEVCVRSNVIEYQDCFVWDASACVSACVSECARAGVGVEPEDFARQTCLDLGLPAEMQPVIAARVRETVLKSLLDALEKSDVLVDPSSAKDTVSRISLKLLQPKEVVAQVSELWTQAVPRGKHRVKEAGFEAATVPSSQSNASIWL